MPEGAEPAGLTVPGKPETAPPAPTERAASQPIEAVTAHPPVLAHTRKAAAEQPAAQKAAPTIRVTIGRIEVRAVVPAPPTPRPAAEPRMPALPLDQYLKQRGEGRR